MAKMYLLDSWNAAKARYERIMHSEDEDEINKMAAIYEEHGNMVRVSETNRRDDMKMSEILMRLKFLSWAFYDSNFIKWCHFIAGFVIGMVIVEMGIV